MRIVVGVVERVVHFVRRRFTTAARAARSLTTLTGKKRRFFIDSCRWFVVFFGRKEQKGGKKKERTHTLIVVEPGFTCSSSSLVSFTEFYRVLPSFAFAGGSDEVRFRRLCADGPSFFLNKFISAHDVVFLLFLSLLTGQKKRTSTSRVGALFFSSP